MSLRVWLPLTKDLRNQGLDSMTITNSGAIFNSTGKLGGCYYFNGSAYLYGESISANMKSASLWIKLNNIDTQVVFADYKSKLGFGIYSNYLVCSCADNTIRTTYPKTLLETDTWIHIAIIRKESLIELYINGELQTPGTSKDSWSTNMSDLFTIGARSNGSTKMIGYIDDFRMYDHCLSSMEVKQLSQGLILHYSLNRGGFGQDNLATCTTPQYNLSASTGNYNYFWIASKDTLTVGETYTVSAEVTVSDNIERCTIYNYHTNPITSGPQYNYFPADGKRHSWTFTATATGLLGYCGVAGATANHTAVYKNIKIEKGSIATPYIPRSNETLYTSMGLNGTTEYDCSGFCNNGIRNKTFTWTSDTPKYAVSQNFDNNHLIEAEGLPTEASTIACWIKWHTLPSGYTIPIHDKQSGLAIGLTNKTRLISYVGTTSGGTGSCVNVSLETNVWYHIVVVKTGTNTRKVYINGEEITSMASNNYWGGDLNKFLVGGRHISGSYSNYIDGQICDVRAYATALSADDVKSLYQNCATIDPDGTIRGQIRS